MAATIDVVEVVCIFHSVLLQYLPLHFLAVVSNHYQVGNSGCLGGIAPAVIMIDCIPREPFQCRFHLSLRVEDVAAAVERELAEESFSFSFKVVIILCSIGGSCSSGIAASNATVHFDGIGDASGSDVIAGAGVRVGVRVRSCDSGGGIDWNGFELDLTAAAGFVLRMIVRGKTI